jgi:hypothetical protein
MNKRIRTVLLSPASVTLLAGLILLAALLARAQWDPFELVRVGTRYSQGAAGGSEGYDGQFFYYIARDLNPETVAQYLDVPAYRYQRILLPVLAQLLSFGQSAWLPWLLPAIGLLSHILGVHLLGQLFERWKVNRWYALTYGLLLGNLLAIRLALPEALAFSLVIAAIWLEQNGRTKWAWVCFTLAVFAKETTIFFLAAQWLSYAFSRRWRDALGFALVAGLPIALFRLWLWSAFGSLGFGVGGAGATPPVLLPFSGLLLVGEYDSVFMFAVALLYLPVVLLPALWGLWAGGRRLLAGGLMGSPDQAELPAWGLFLNAAIFPFLPISLYVEPLGTLRLAVGLQLAVLLFSARYRVQRVLNYSLLWILFDAWLFS